MADESFEELLSTEKEKSCAQGRHEGEDSGYEKAQKELFALFHLLFALSDKLLEHKEQLLAKLKPEIIDFSLSICEKILKSELSHKEKLAKLISSYLERRFEGEKVLIFLTPEDLILLDPFLQEMANAERTVHFLADTNLERGDFRIETKTSIMNGTLSRQLEELRTKILIS